MVGLRQRGLLILLVRDYLRRVWRGGRFTVGMVTLNGNDKAAYYKVTSA